MAGATPSARRVDSLDGLRGWLALIVVLTHATETVLPAMSGAGPSHLGIEHLVRRSPFMVFLSGDFAARTFFVLSGFVLTLKFARSRDPRWPTAMLYRRPIRLGLPVFASTILVYGLTLALPMRTAQMANATGAKLYATNPSAASTVTDAIFGNMLWASGRVPGVWWTMPVELYCSLALLLVLMCWTRLSPKLRRPLCVSYLVVVAAWASSAPAPRLYFQTVSEALALCALLSVAFVLGALLAVAWTDHPEWFAPRATTTHLWWMAGLGAVVAGVFPSITQPLFGGEALGQLATLVAAAVVVAVVLRFNPIQSFLERGLSQFLGRISFALYLVHFGVQSTVLYNVFLRLLAWSAPYNVAGTFAIVVSIGVSIALAQLLSVSVDRVAVSFGKNRAQRWAGIESPAAH